MTALSGVMDTSPATSLTRVTKSYLLALGTTQISSYFTKHLLHTCFFCTTCPTVGKLANSIRHPFAYYCVTECLLTGWWNVKTMYAEIREYRVYDFLSSIVCPLTTRPCSANPSSKPEQYHQVQQYDTKEVMWWCIICLDLSGGHSSSVRLSHKIIHKKGEKTFFRPLRGGAGVSCMAVIVHVRSPSD